MKNNLIILFLYMVFTSCTGVKYFLSGSYTDGKNDGIHLLKLKNNRISVEKSYQNIENPSYFVMDNSQEFLYCVNENSKENDEISSFKIEEKSLKKVDFKSSEGISPCHISLDKKEKFLVVSNYSSGNIVIYKFEKGKISQPIQNIKLTENAHAHFSAFTKDNQFIFVTDLAHSKLYRFSFDENQEKPIQPNPKIYSLEEQSGARHFVMDKNQAFLYLLNEWNATINVFKIEENDLILKQTISSTNFENHQQNKGSAAIKISPCGKFLYASNRGDSNSISVFKIEEGLIKKLDEIKTGLHPRDFTIDKTGCFLLVALRDSNEVSLYKINKKTGFLTFENSVKVIKPVFLSEIN